MKLKDEVLCIKFIENNTTSTHKNSETTQRMTV